MRKLINGKVRNTEKMELIGYRTSHRSYSNDPIGWEAIYMSNEGCYYLETTGGNDIFAPEDDLCLVAGTPGELIEFIESNEEWARDTEVLDHIEKLQ